MDGRMTAERVTSGTTPEIELFPTLEAPGRAREFVRRQLAVWGLPNSVDNATVIVSEVVSNAIAAAPHAPVRVSLRLVGSRAILEVRDCCPDPPVFQSVDPMAESGRGLHVVTALSATVDWFPVHGGKVMWVLLQ